RARIALCGVGPTPVRARAAEDALVGQAPTTAVLDEAADRAAAATSPPSDVHGSAEFRRKLARHFARQALAAAIQRSGGRCPCPPPPPAPGRGPASATSSTWSRAGSSST